jgi:hypothetical protein
MDCADALFLNQTSALYSLETTVSERDSGLLCSLTHSLILEIHIDKLTFL